MGEGFVNKSVPTKRQAESRQDSHVKSNQNEGQLERGKGKTEGTRKGEKKKQSPTFLHARHAAFISSRWNLRDASTGSLPSFLYA